MKLKKSKFLDSIIDESHSIESKLLQFYVVAELIWAFVNFAFCVVLRMPFETMFTFCMLFIGLTLLFFVGYKLNAIKIVKEIYFILVIVTIPLVWYFTGGPRTASSILFICELIIFVMCLKGNKQKIYMTVTLITIPIVQGVAQRLPYPIFPMDERQYQIEGTLIGLTTSLLIASLLLKQKYEYSKERDAAVESEKLLEKSNALQKNFLANMSHEIRSPLGIVMGFNNLISESQDVEQIHQYSKDITQAGTTLLTVINDILDYSKIESGKLDIIEGNYSFTALMAEIKKDIGLKCAEKGIKFVTRIDGNIPQNLYGDNIRIKQCLINILSNAVKYTEAGTITLECVCEGFSEKGYQLKYVVTDTGKGIKEEAIPNLFTAFQRLDEGANRGIEGTGLGLAITKNLLDQMKGSIEVSSKLGAGSTFTIHILQGRGQMIQEEVVVENPVQENLNGINVLVVDDTELNLVLVKKLLDKKNVNTTTINNGKDCLEDIKKNKYDIILLDHMMPEMNGVEVFERMREQSGMNEDTPVVMLTANAMSGASQEYLEMGFDGYLSKPIVPKDLYEMIDKLVVR